MNSSSNQSLPDYFTILGIGPSATDEQIKQAYRDLAFEFHPDRNESPEAHQTFLQVGEAYRVLTNPDLKRRYLNQYNALNPGIDQEKMKSALQQRTEFNRIKRSERYRSGRYTQRVRYRGAASSKSSQAPWEQRPPVSRSRTTTRSYSPEHLDAEIESSQVGYRVYSWLMSAVAIGLLLFCAAMWTDKALTEDLATEQVKSKRRSSQIFVAMNGMKIKTTRHSFLIHGEESRKLPKGREVTLMKSPYGRFLTHVKVIESGFEWKFGILDGPYGVHFWMTYVVAFFSFLTLILRKRHQGSAYVGTINIILALSMMSLIFTV